MCTSRSWQNYRTTFPVLAVWNAWGSRAWHVRDMDWSKIQRIHGSPWHSLPGQAKLRQPRRRTTSIDARPPGDTDAAANAAVMWHHPGNPQRLPNLRFRHPLAYPAGVFVNYFPWQGGPASASPGCRAPSQPELHPPTGIVLVIGGSDYRYGTQIRKESNTKGSTQLES